VRVTGIGMFDFLHGQTGVAPNGIELHPVLNIVFNPGTAQPLNAAEPLIAAVPTAAGETTVTFDDDGGKVQIVPVDASPQGIKQNQDGSRTSLVQQVSIFLGSGWGDPETRSRESVLSNLASVHGSIQTSDITRDNTAALGTVVPQEDFSDLSGTPINDLFIQGKLSELLKSNAIPVPTPASVYVVFLGPGINSTLGGLKAGEGYAAYHNFVNLDQGEVRYVVVPFQPDLGRQAAAAARALAETQLNRKE
jgi:hypothetical protein